MSRRILVLDGDCSAAVSVVQSLGRAGYEVVLAGTSFEHRAFRSRYLAGRARYPDPLLDKDGFQAWCVEQREHALVIPVTERSLMPLHEVRDHPALRGRLAVPPAQATVTGFDKEAVRGIAEQLGIPVPANVIVGTSAELGMPILDAWLEHGAVVLKSLHSKVWGDGGGRELSVQMAVNRQQLERQATQMLECGPLQAQQWVPGHGVGIEVLVDHGEIVLSFAHERLHELPLTGGGSCYRRAIHAPAELLEASQKLLRAMGWHGVAMVEFRHDPQSGDSWMMEINGRFWGSLPLAQFAGVDFPRALVELLLDGKRPVQTAARMVYARAFGRDIEWLKQMARVRIGSLRRRGKPPAEHRLILVRPVLPSLFEWGRLLVGRETWDGASFRDPGPIMWEIRTEFGKLYCALAKRWRRRGLRRAAVAEWRRPLHHVRRILVLCSGNICRSAYVGVKLDAIARDRLEVRSGALAGPSGRPSPALFADVARMRGVDLADHRSHAVDDSDLAWADLILIMDERHQQALAMRDPSALAKTRWLGAVATSNGADPTIADPIDFDARELDGSLDQMDRTIESLVRCVLPPASTAYND